MRKGLADVASTLVYGLTTGNEVEDMHPNLDVATQLLTSVCVVFSRGRAFPVRV